MPARKIFLAFRTILIVGLYFPTNSYLYEYVSQKAAFFTQQQLLGRIHCKRHCACEQCRPKTFDSSAAQISFYENSHYKRLRNKTRVLGQDQINLQEKRTQHLDGLNLKSLFVSYWYQHVPEERHGLLMRRSVIVLKKYFLPIVQAFTTPKTFKFRKSTYIWEAILSSCASNVHHKLVEKLSVHKNRMFQQGKSDALWNESVSELISCFLGMVQIYKDKITTVLKAGYSVAYPVHSVVPNFSKTFRLYLVHHDHTPVGILSVFSLLVLIGQEEAVLFYETLLIFLSTVILSDP